MQDFYINLHFFNIWGAIEKRFYPKNKAQRPTIDNKKKE